MYHREQTRVTRGVKKSQIPVTEWVTPALPLDQAGCIRLGEPPPRELLSVNEISSLHEFARKDDHDELLSSMRYLADKYFTTENAILLMAIDPSTGDSLFHTGIRAQQLDALAHLRKTFPPNGSFRLGEKAIFKHKNHAGETMLPTAVKTGNIDMVVSAYRLFGRDKLVNEERCAGWGQHLEEHTELPDDGVPHITFLLEKNSEGRDAATIAREIGYGSLAQWIDTVVTRLDPAGQRHDAEQRQKWECSIRDYYKHEYKEVLVGDDEINW
ncbi:hypothetical protein DL765_003541 [Monosporascus sp. GIB2]|nr:hypothetical protein DL765_003541 [Monosporascus sp. GIB2]